MTSAAALVVLAAGGWSLGLVTEPGGELGSSLSLLVGLVVFFSASFVGLLPDRAQGVDEITQALEAGPAEDRGRAGLLRGTGSSRTGACSCADPIGLPGALRLRGTSRALGDPGGRSAVGVVRQAMLRRAPAAVASRSTHELRDIDRRWPVGVA